MKKNDAAEFFIQMALWSIMVILQSCVTYSVFHFLSGGRI